MWMNWGNILSPLNAPNGHLTSWLLMRLSSPLQRKWRTIALLFIRKAFKKQSIRPSSVCVQIKGSILCIYVCVCHFWELPRRKKSSIFYFGARWTESREGSTGGAPGSTRCWYGKSWSGWKCGQRWTTKVLNNANDSETSTRGGDAWSTAALLAAFSSFQLRGLPAYQQP